MDFARADIRKLGDNPWKLMDEDWALISAGDPGRLADRRAWNAMTASWGGFGVLWNKDMAFIFVRPVRHTYAFLERDARFSLSFFDEAYREALEICGSRSGRDGDKIAAAGLRPLGMEGPFIGYEEARLVLCCRSVYSADIDPGRFKEASIQANYPDGDYHRMYIGEIESAWKRA